MKDRIMTTRTLKIQRGRRRGKWFVMGLPGPDCTWCGPYDTKNEAVDDARGLRRFYEELEQYLEPADSETADEPDKRDAAG